MYKPTLYHQTSKNKTLFFLILFVGILSRTVLFGKIPAGLHQDEAFAGYEAWSLLKYGIDSAGYHNPVYLTAWGSGMNALESYLMIPFIALFGLKIWVIRLPQLIISVLSLPCIYHTVCILKDRKTALYAMFILAICPWHIMLSRWGLESNLLPGFMLFAFYFFLKGIGNNRFFIPSAIMFGLSLYTYAVSWPFIPLFLILSIFYLFFIKKSGCSIINKHTIISVIVLFVLAIPLLLFLAVNYELIQEIRTSWISIPKLGYFRSAEMNLQNVYSNLKSSMRIIIYGTDNLAYNTPRYLHLLYWPTLLFIIVGSIQSLISFIASIKDKKYTPVSFLLFWLAIAFCECATVVEANANRINICFIPLIISSSIGITFALEKIQYKHLDKIIIFVYLMFFSVFELYYFTAFKSITNNELAYGVVDAVKFADNNGKNVYIPYNECVFYPEVLFALEYPTNEFIDTVEYRENPAMYLKPTSIGKYHWGFDCENLDNDCVYIMDSEFFESCKSIFYENGFSSDNFGKYVVCYIP